MMCCAIAALLMAAFAALRSVAKRVLTILPLARWVAASFAVFLMLAGGSALMARGFDRAPRQTDFSTFLMQHICAFAPQGAGAALSPGRGNTKR
jgi:hypothetical protein